MTEEARLESLRCLNQLDTPAEARFDRLTRLAARHFRVPYCLVTLLDRDRQWFKSTYGLQLVETSRDISICSHTIQGEGPMIVKDLTQDDRFADYSVVKDPDSFQVRFYAGVPIKAPDGAPVGTLCVLDVKSRELQPEDVEALQDLAACAEAELSVQRLTLSEAELLAEKTDLQRRECLCPATRCWNEKMIMDVLERERSRSRRLNQPLATIRVLVPRDTDEAGWRAIAEAARRCLRAYDSLGRIDSQLLAIVPGAGQPQAEKLARRIVEAAAPHALRYEVETEQRQVGLKACLFGAFQLVRNGQAVPHQEWKTSKTRYLLAYLLSQFKRSAPQDTLVDQFWSASDEKAKRSLWGAISNLRTVLRPALEGHDDPFVREGEWLSFHPQLEIWCDLDEFQTAARDGRRLADSGRPVEAIAELRRVAQLYQGPFLDGCYMEWALDMRTRHERTYCDSLTLLARLLMAQAQPAQAVEMSEKVLAIDPDRADTLAILFRALMAQGRPDAVIARFKKLGKESEPTLELVELYHRARLGIA